MFNKLNNNLYVKNLKDQSLLTNLDSKELYILEKDVIFNQNCIIDDVNIIESVEDVKEDFQLLESKTLVAEHIRKQLREMVEEYLTKYNVKKIHRIDKHISAAEKLMGLNHFYMGNDIEKVIISNWNQNIGDDKLVWTSQGTSIVIFSNDGIQIIHKNIGPFGYKMKTIFRKDIKDIKINKGLIWANLIIDTNSENIMLGNIHKKAFDEIHNYLDKYLGKKIKIKEIEDKIIEPEYLSLDPVNSVSTPKKNKEVNKKLMQMIMN